MSEYVISSDLHAIDRDVVFRFLHEDAYWSAGLPRDVFDRSLESSLCFSAFAGKHGPQVGFARVVSDRATFAWLCDVFVLPEHRGKG
ncbi:MAG: GNAT family N-acetyltransferase, partial [Chloroflexi bacterium]